MYRRGFLDFLRLEKDTAANTLLAYDRDLAKFTAYLADVAPDTSPQSVTYEQLSAFVMALHRCGIAPASQARMVSALRAFFNYLRVEDVIAASPAQLLETPRLSRKIPAVLSVEEIEALLAAIDMSTPQGQRNRAMIEVMYACGLRVSELIGLRISGLHLAEEFIEVVGKGGKLRYIPIAPTAIAELQRYLSYTRTQLNHIHAPDVVFLNQRGKPLSRVYVFTMVKALAESIGLDKNISPHTFRHSFATHLIEGGANLRIIQELLGHASITTTEIYTHLDAQYLRDTVMQFHPLQRRGRGKG